MGWTDIAAALGTSGGHVRDIAFGRKSQIAVTTHNKIMKIEQAASRGQYIDATGTVRRIRALVANGHSLQDIADGTGSVPNLIQGLHAGKARIRRFVAERIAQGYQEMAERQGDCGRARRRAAREGWAPPAAWDDDTLDDPAASPDWTGHCGTDRGWWMHTSQKLPMCEACKAAHEAWKADHQGLPRRELMSALFLARAAASTRGAELAEDGRELLRLGHTAEQAAARLGISKDHLQQELARHPMALAQAAA
ncbi:hypothetical protein ACFWMX_14800 [Streptomyces sp. NPDC058378]|uniref:hypothetical protein n=1 Tax=Streptomyces sp. NPDC058378 TaxID=3346469 RepID=UPI0036623041